MNENKLFLNIYTNVGSDIQDTTATMATHIKRYCNEGYRAILKRFNWDGINPDHTIAIVAGTQDYVLPGDFGKEMYVYDATNLRYVPFIALIELSEKFADSLSAQGLAERYTIFRDVVRKQPTSASILTVVSSDNNDTTQTVRIKGTDANDVEVDESVTLTGTTNAVTTGTFKSIRSISKSAATVGRVTITSNSAAVTNAVLALADLDYKVLKLRVHQIPNNAATWRVPYHVRPYPLSNDNDVPVVDCADGIELFARMRAWQYKRQYGKAGEVERAYEKWLNDAAWDLENQPNQPHLLNPKPYPRDDD